MAQNAHYLEGPLSKWTNLVNGWQYRWFVLNYQTGILTYFTSRDKMKRGSRRGCVYLQKAMIGIDDEDDSGFIITSDSKQFHFQARDTQDREKWVRALECAIFHQQQKGLKPAAPNFETSAGPGGKPASFNFPMDDKKQFDAVPKKFDFDAKIAEADAYLQILISQLKNLEVKISQMNQEDEMHKKYLEIKVSTNALIDSVKHSIVILQITRNALFPSTGIYQSTLPPLIIKTPLSSQVAVGLAEKMLDPMAPYSDNLMEGAILGTILDQPTPPSELSSPDLSPNLGLKHKSFSSSDEDFFFDAEEEEKLANSVGKVASARLTPYFSPQPENRAAKLGSAHTKGDIVVDLANGKFTEIALTNPENKGKPSTGEWLKENKNNSNTPNLEDLLFQDSSEEELEDISNYGGVIKHLLSQVRIGMDLTKVTLPTFILERRSLLEMFADFFAHAQLFSNITDMATPKERMTEIVRYYLSSFHTGRKSAVAKKPFNPILGETFKCYYDTTPNVNQPPQTDQSRATLEKLLIGSPMVEAGPGNLTFVAEQVSHHPPISAFYAENVAKSVCLNANIWTKSKFLGLSIGVHMIGQGVINLLEHGEEYVCTFPNAYARSIFSIPWIEMGGKVTVTCSKTGYFANIEFLTKPFYGGGKNQISAQLFSPYEKSPYLTISGEWNGIMNARTSDDESFEFLDTQTIPTQVKQVKPVAEQEEYESRRIWKGVAQSLKARELEQATEYKHAIEERQREEAKLRLEHGMKWECKFFDEINGNWVYKRPLYKRIPA